VNDRFCVDCHGDLDTSGGAPTVARSVKPFPSGHPEFSAAKSGAKDPGGLKFNHQVHTRNDGIRGPKGMELLECGQCHKPEIARTIGKRTLKTGLMTTASYADACARCHPIYFDELIDAKAPHDRPQVVRAFVTQALASYIEAHPDEIGRPSTVRRVPLNFPRPAEPPARNASEWVARRLAADERLLWAKTCAECHERRTDDRPAPNAGGLPTYADSRITARWMPRASFEHTPHFAVQCTDCHAAERSLATTDVLMPPAATCSACHAPGRGAESRCFECHEYHDWTKSHAVAPSYRLSDFK
jgi:hypothetical protein